MVSKRKNELWEEKCEIERCLEGTIVTEAWKTVKGIREERKRSI